MRRIVIAVMGVPVLAALLLGAVLTWSDRAGASGPNTWSATGIPDYVTGAYSATLLPNGKVLVLGGGDAGGAITGNADLYDPVLNTWSVAPSMSTPRVFQSATLLQNGRVLVVGGGQVPSSGVRA